jgi:hypothetical protein
MHHALYHECMRRWVIGKLGRHIIGGGGGRRKDGWTDRRVLRCRIVNLGWEMHNYQVASLRVGG